MEDGSVTFGVGMDPVREVVEDGLLLVITEEVPGTREEDRGVVVIGGVRGVVVEDGGVSVEEGGETVDGTEGPED